jgi:hypothetical protein
MFPEEEPGMRATRAFGIKSWFSCFVLNSLLLGAIFLMARETAETVHRWLDPFVGANAAGLPEDAQLAFNNLAHFVGDIERYLAPGLAGLGLVITLILWLLIGAHGRRLKTAAALQMNLEPVTSGPAREIATGTEPMGEVRYAQRAPEAAIQMLAILQRQGRLIDFLQEDLSLYDDAQIGAAVRNVHAGCKQALEDHLELKPVFDENEGSTITVPPGFDAAATRLTGNVVGDPPFQGQLRHRGWRVVHVELPQLTELRGKDWILAPAEVEVS